VTLETFIVAATASVAASVVLVTCLERVGERWRLSEALLGLVVALAADGPEITSAITAMVTGQRAVGVGVVIGSNVFNLAALLGLGAIIAGRLALPRVSVALEGVLASTIACIAVAVAARWVSPLVGLTVALLVFLPYVAICAMRPAQRSRLPLPPWLVTRLRRAIEVEEIDAIHPIAGSRRDAIVGLGAVVVVIVASVGMEQSAATLGSQARVSDLAIGALLLAAVTSLPNAVAAIYLATRHRGLAAMSEAFHSNAFNVIIGLLIPAVLTGVVVSGGGFLVAIWYLALTVAAVVLALVGRGLGRLGGIVIVGGYVAFVVTVIAL
jgi:cation:H+ antiporter